ncbi:MAG TPA: phosphoglycerate kinase [Candidatus Saccharimonadales bacterium]|nr:phosphoglycerate kinase [Candidatus Saccharimonadales bacterium]
MFTKQTVKDIDLKGKRVLLRADYNVPVDDNGQITDDYRIQQSLPTIKYLLSQNVTLIICSHLGRPDGKPNAKLSLFPVAKRLKELLNVDVEFVPDCIGERVKKAASNLKSGQILVLENLRFHPEEEANDDGFAKQLAALADVFVQDGFGVVHRAHASTEAITHHLPSVAGLLLEKEVDTITNVMENPKRPLAAIIGGAKIADKIDVLNKFIDIADFVAIGGAMANVFLMAEGIPIAKSKVEPDDKAIAKDVIARAKAKAAKQSFIFYIPQDAVVATSLDKIAKTRIVDWSAHVIADIESYPKRPPEASRHITDDEMILDIGPFSGAFVAGALQLSGTVVWNGTMGVTETVGLQGPIGPFAHGTELLIEAMLGQFGHRPFSLVGGGDTVGYIEERHLVDSFDHVSTGGGASLELMAGGTLPGVAALLDKTTGVQ